MAVNTSAIEQELAIASDKLLSAKKRLEDKDGYHQEHALALIRSAVECAERAGRKIVRVIDSRYASIRG